ncbi:SMC-Scp complex subunit ScpB [Candidatus Uhrbacteria bacterium RIFOXYB12_FULL_58_10]|uniref:SMC-Scp complex subunit ScpB n=1 Tax=Candidatus Uhrbacteria bacterium RIFOXYB2_FULL_57_15 TaxID=1802422 RepID=A0A1F7W9H3_9BACT|nr:MAG: SMC-Scp complex subunit ScpB [Candidatus Uhrbacteria bacterium RIFOXYB12_FULL_58_10]OGL99008.1 MAG: SMC-Scp complex subunit ScpB [Candidatus Uhrbacteria bacterium RIFOXYB2_FULL_57_15]
MILTSLESILFASSKPIAISSLKKILSVSDEVLHEAIASVKERFNVETSGIHIVEHEGKIQFVTNPSQTELIAALLREETSGELTRPSVETLTIIAYRGPITKPEIEQIRGVNCTLIIRNLLMRGLIDEMDDVERLQPVYTVSTNFVRHLGLHDLSELPDFDELHQSEKITELMESLGDSEA